MKRVAIVGATEGIGRALAFEYAREGWAVGVLGRNEGKLADVEHALRDAHPAATVASAVLDVTDRDRVTVALDEARAALGGLDLLIYNAGVLGSGPEAVEEMVRVNTLGAIDALEWGATLFTTARSGHLAAVGSVAGDRGRKGNPVYAATKAGLEAYLEGLRARLHPVGVRVSTIKPGWVQTRMLGDAPGFPPSISAEDAARRIRLGLQRGRESFYVPAWWALVSLALRLLPRPLFKRLAPP